MSASVATQTQYTPEDLLAMPDGKSYELVGGHLVERNMGAESSWVGGRLLSRLSRFCEGPGVGWAFPADNGYQCFPHEPDLVRKPDVSLIRFGRLAGERIPKGWIKIAPDLAVEVVSPKDRVSELDVKVDEYLKAGVKLIWIIYPETMKVQVWRGDGSVIPLRAGDELSGEDVLPGFRCKVEDLFPKLTAAVAQEPMKSDSDSASREPSN